MSEAFSIPESTVKLLQTPHPLHDDALELYENGDFIRADEVFAEAAAISRTRTIRLSEIVPGADDREIELNRDVAYGRVLLHWALSTEAQYRYDLNEALRHEMFALALARASRGLVLLSQDQHKIVEVDELDSAQDIVKNLRDKVTETTPQKTPATLPDPTHGLDQSDAEIIELAEASRALAA